MKRNNITEFFQESTSLPVKRNYLAFYKANTRICHHHKQTAGANIPKRDFS